VESPKGNIHIFPATATDDPARVGQVETVILGVKAWQIPQAAAALKPIVGPGTLVLPLQNGIEAPRQLAEVLGQEAVLAGLCRIICQLAAPGLIQHTAAEPYIALGELDNRPTSRVRRLRDTLLSAGIQAEIAENIQAAMWEKFIFIAASSGVGAVTRVPFDVLLEVPETRAMYRQALEEGLTIAQANGIPLPNSLADRLVRLMAGLRPGSTASMQRDVMAGRPSELGQLSGALVRLGEALGVPTPLHRWIFHSLLPMERIARNENLVGGLS
jgi:2-dehydropantoate 2-reductase